VLTCLPCASVTHYTGQQDTDHQSKVVVGGRALSHRTTMTRKARKWLSRFWKICKARWSWLFSRRFAESRWAHPQRGGLVAGKLDNSQANRKIKKKRKKPGTTLCW
jgi:hypothetical protein